MKEEIHVLPETLLEAERRRQKYMASPTLPPFILSPEAQTKQNQWKESHGNADCWIAGSAPCGTKQSRGKAGSGSKSKEAIDWHDPLRQGFQIPNL